MWPRKSQSYLMWAPSPSAWELQWAVKGWNRKAQGCGMLGKSQRCCNTLGCFPLVLKVCTAWFKCLTRLRLPWVATVFFTGEVAIVWPVPSWFLTGYSSFSTKAVSACLLKKLMESSESSLSWMAPHLAHCSFYVFSCLLLSLKPVVTQQQNIMLALSFVFLHQSLWPLTFPALNFGSICLSCASVSMVAARFHAVGCLLFVAPGERRGDFSLPVEQEAEQSKIGQGCHGL